MKKRICTFITGFLLLFAGVSLAVANDAASQTLTDSSAVEVQPLDSDATVIPQEGTVDSSVKTSLSATASAAVWSEDEDTASAISSLARLPQFSSNVETKERVITD